MRIFAYVGLIEIVSIFSEPMQTVKAGLSADSPSLLSHVRSGVTALSSQCLWKSVWHAKAPGVLAGDRDVGLQGSSTGRLVGKVLLLLGRLISVTSALFLVSVPKPGRVFAAQCTRETRWKEMQEISLCICPVVVVVVTIFLWRCPSHVPVTQPSAHSPLPWCPQATEVQGIQHISFPLGEESVM